MQEKTNRGLLYLLWFGDFMCLCLLELIVLCNSHVQRCDQSVCKFLFMHNKKIEY